MHVADRAAVIAALVVGVTAFVVFVERGQRQILVNYAKRQVGQQGLRRARRSHLPLKLNMSGVIPPIFASSHHPVPGDARRAGSAPAKACAGCRTSRRRSRPGQPIYVMLYAAAIVFFCFFYTALVFNPKETADNLKK